jgi:hypothetical protein
VNVGWDLRFSVKTAKFSLKTMGLNTTNTPKFPNKIISSITNARNLTKTYISQTFFLELEKFCSTGAQSKKVFLIVKTDLNFERQPEV